VTLGPLIKIAIPPLGSPTLWFVCIVFCLVPDFAFAFFLKTWWTIGISAGAIFGAICPKQGKGATLVLPFCNTEAMNLHLAEIAKAVAQESHAVLRVDRAGWHLSAELPIPVNITILALPAKCPELNPVENIWQYMRENCLSNRVFKSCDDIADHCC
jgi:hypothetical protein